MFICACFHHRPLLLLCFAAGFFLVNLFFSFLSGFSDGMALEGAGADIPYSCTGLAFECIIPVSPLGLRSWLKLAQSNCEDCRKTSRPIKPNMPSSCLYWADLIILVLDLAEGIITTIHFDEDTFGMWHLALFWVCWNFAYELVLHYAKKIKWIWLDCLLKCLGEIAQCVLYVYFCSEDAGMTVPLIVMACCQIVLKLIGTVMEMNREQEDEELGNLENVGMISSIMTHCSGLLCCCFAETKRKSAVEKLLEIQDKVEKLSRSPYGAFVQGLLSLFPLFYQEESPFRAKWYEVTMCVVLWLSSLMRSLQVKSSGSDDRALGGLTIGIEILSTGWAAFRVCLNWFWGFSPELSAQFDRVVTVILMASPAWMLCLAWCFVYLTPDSVLQRLMWEKVAVARFQQEMQQVQYGLQQLQVVAAQKFGQTFPNQK